MPRRKTKRRTPEQLAVDAEARVRLERARLQHTALKAHRKAVSLATHQAAKKDRTNRDWDARQRSADASIIPDRATLDARSRQMHADDGIYRSIVRSYKRNAVGTGINPSPSAMDESGELLEDFNARAEALWFDWARRPELVERERRANFPMVLRWAISEFVQAGEAIVIKSYEKRGDHVGLTLQRVESEQLDPYKLEHEGREVRGGIEVDEYGAPVAYWIFDRHPNDFRGMRRPMPLSMQSERIPAHRVCHLMDPERARQTRGVTMMTPTLSDTRQLGTYDRAQVLAAKAEACMGLIVRQETPQAPIGLAESPEGTTMAGSGGDADSDAVDELAMQPLMVARLGPGEDVSSFTPQRPGGQYEPFSRHQVRKIAAGAGTSYEQAMRDFSQGNFSSQRQGALEDRREYEWFQQLAITQLCQPIYESFLWFAFLEGRLDRWASDYFQAPDRFNYAEWRGQGWDWVDPAKEATGLEKLINLDLETRKNILLGKGRDWREVARQRAEEKKLDRKLGLTEADHQAAAESQDEPDPAESPPDPEPASPADEEAGVDAQERLSGIDAQRAQEMLDAVSAGTSSPKVVEMILIGMGFGDDDAREMVQAAQDFEPRIPPDAENADTQHAEPAPAEQPS